MVACNLTNITTSTTQTERDDMNTGQSRMIVDQTGSDNFSMFLNDFRNHFLEYPETGRLPEEIADIFSVRLFNSKQTGMLHIIVSFAED